MTDTVSSVQSHYRMDDLTARILAALEAAGRDINGANAETFYPVDQLHGGGLDSTRAQAELAGVSEAMRVLDAGCGIGGGARFLAHTYNCQVEAMDLTQEFVDTAIRLTELSGLAAQISIRQGDVTKLPFADASFDLVWCQNVTMNVEDKPRLFAEAYRVLRQGGRYTFSHAAEVAGSGAPYYPLPFARTADYSFLGSEDQILAWLEGAGFRVLENRSEGGGGAGGAGPDPRPPGPLGPGLVMGDDMAERGANMQRSASEGRIKGMLVVAERPA
jgi:SAM-dependent methyltransferase